MKNDQAEMEMEFADEPSASRHDATEVEAVREVDFPWEGIFREQLRFLLHYAVLAPSTHNTQPWKFDLTPEGIEVYADYSRRMPVVDPGNRELLMSVGAAVFNLRVAASHFNMPFRVDYNLSGASELPLATISLASPESKNPASSGLGICLANIPLRHTNRSPFLVSRIPSSVIAKLKSAADGAQTEIVVTVDGALNQKVADLVAEAEGLQWSDAGFRKDLAEWIRPGGSTRQDGIPGTVYGWKGPVDDLGAYATRVIDQGRLRAARDRNLCLEAPGLIVLATEDSVSHWIEAGEVLQQLLLAIVREGLHASYFNMPIQVPDFRTRLKALMPCSGWPQLLLRVGYCLTQSVPTPRRPLDAFLVHDAS